MKTTTVSFFFFLTYCTNIKEKKKKKSNSSNNNIKSKKRFIKASEVKVDPHPSAIIHITLSLAFCVLIRSSSLLCSRVTESSQTLLPL